MKPNLSSPFTLGISVFAAVSALTQTEPQAPDSTEQGLGSSEIRVAERGQDFAVYQRITAVTNTEGFARFRTNEWTLLENGLHFFDAETGDWQPSRDLIESFPEGAIARYGPVRAIFSHDLNSESVFDLETPEGARLRGGVRALEWYDGATGQRVTLATVKAFAPIELVPPNRLIARDAFDGVLADVILEWRHNRFSQSVVLREQPLLPESFDPVTTRLAVITEFVEAPEPEINRVITQADGQAQAEDHVTISFAGVSILLGHAFAVSAADGEAGLSLGTIRGRDQAVPVRKTWEPLPDGGAVLVESVSLAEAELLWGGLPKQTQARSTSLRNRRTVRVEQVEERRPVELAQAAYQPAGVIVDFETVTSANSFTFAMGQTYVVPGAVFLGPGAVAFQAGCTVKFATNAYILLYGPPTFTDTLQTPVFTSVNDDSFGEDVDGNPGGQPSVPSHHANPALWMYYLTSSTTVKNARVRWAKQGIHYDSNESSAPMNYLNHSLFERCQMGVYMNWYAKVTMSGVEKNDVAVPWQVVYPPPYGGSCPGCSMTQAPFYTGKSFAGLNGDSGYPVPDTMGAIGPSHFLEVLNDQVAVLRKATGQIEPDFTSQMTPSEFFAPGESLVFMDPRVWFDHGSQRWVVSAMHAENQGAGDKVVLKVSKTSTPNLDASNWWRYPVSFPSLPSEQWVDFPTLALDANGVYLSVQIRESSSIRHGFRILTFKKPDVYNGNYTPPAPLVVTNGELDTWCIQPAYNFDTVAAGAYVWLVAKGPNSGSQGGLIHYRRIQWNGANAQWVGSWVPVNAAYRDYYDIPQNSPLSAPQTVALGGTASRLMMATIRNSYLWTCHHVGLDGTDGDYDGPWPSAPDRSAVQWLRLKVDEGNLSYNAHGRIFDTVSTNPYWYHFPSVGVNAAGDSVAGFSGSRNGEYIGAFFRGRRANGTWMARPALVQAGRVAYAGSSWGDYSGTTIDPSDGSFWTVQEYADPVVFSSWGTWIVQVQVAQ